MMSPKQHIKTLVVSVARNFFGGHRKVVRVGSLYEKVNFVIQTCAIAHFLRLTEWNNFKKDTMSQKQIFICVIGTLGSRQGVLDVLYYYTKMDVSDPAKRS